MRTTFQDRKEQSILRNKEQALNAFIARKDRIDAMLARLQALSDDHFNTNPDEITWGHEGARPEVYRGTTKEHHGFRLPRRRIQKLIPNHQNHRRASRPAAVPTRRRR